VACDVPRGHNGRLLPPLATRGPHIINAETGAPVRLVGVNRSGLEYAEPSSSTGFLDTAGITRDEIAEITRTWNARIIRLPFNQDFAINGRAGHSADAYLAAIDTVIRWAAEQGAYTLLDLQWLDADRMFGTNSDLSINRVPPLPDAQSIRLWSALAERYRHEPAVLFDIFNEPHSPLPDDPHESCTLAPDGTPVPLRLQHVGMREWQPWARHLIAAIREQHPLALIFVPGVHWAYDLRGMPLLDPNNQPLPNIVYSTHVYPWSRTHRLFLGTWESEWDRAFGHLAPRVPTFAGEWGGRVDDLQWGKRLVRYFETHGMGWCAWSWADAPCLVAACHDRDYTPTPFGAVVRDALLRSTASGDPVI
jgi:endoglucanase